MLPRIRLSGSRRQSADHTGTEKNLNPDDGMARSAGSCAAEGGRSKRFSRRTTAITVKPAFESASNKSLMILHCQGVTADGQHRSKCG